VIGRALGWQHLKSTLFDVERTAAGYRFTGQGLGHGVGLCVLGSSNLANSGTTRDTILGRYFPGLKVIKYGPSISVDATVPAPIPTSAQRAALSVAVPLTDRAEQSNIETIALHALDDLTRRVGTPTPEPISIRFHPTVESYQRATGQSWLTSGAVRGSNVELIPVSALRERGLLERTIRHELTHVLTAAALKGRPLWVLEGAALHFSGETERDGLAGSGAPGSCPADDELRSPASAAALRSAYTRAAGCFEAQMRVAKDWRAIR
jgi:hypothetical protein